MKYHKIEHIIAKEFINELIDRLSAMKGEELANKMLSKLEKITDWELDIAADLLSDVKVYDDNL